MYITATTVSSKGFKIQIIASNRKNNLSEIAPRKKMERDPDV
jgi:hypothetical protein